MKINILFSQAILFLMLFTASALHAGYKLDPWGSKTWTGPGEPPHWSPRLTKSDNSVAYKKRAHTNWRTRQTRGYNSKGGYWKDKHNRWYHHRYKRSGYIYYQKPSTEKVIIERKKRVPVNIRVKQKSTRPQCAGITRSRNDPKTGELIIEYVTGARDC